MIALVSALISLDSLLAGLDHVSRTGDGEPASDIRQAQERSRKKTMAPKCVSVLLPLHAELH